ncbi:MULTISPECIES: universal stress protein [Cupriavidus]|uniref:Universal stress protein n=1 Tax=Cupriavidus oxalaticus TaxID=96344 RepID=A0A4P7LSX8_9BURK|nr:MULTISPECIES: universal stress protein [Cupriavidus]QBY55787.1 universal stress protein [Cupriavidus oxalaticus]TDF67449.1 universal stress protein [Cupriavidus sp. L7L]
MNFRTILVDLTDGPACAARVECAAQVAAAFAGSVVGLTATGTHLEPFRGAGEEAGRYDALARGKLQHLAARHHEALREWVGRVSPTIPTRHVVVEAEAGWALATHGRFADLILPGPPSVHTDVPAGMPGVAEYVMLESGRPILLLPGLAGPTLEGHVAIAWNGSRAAARVVADAMPWLTRAGAVSVLVVASASESPEPQDQESHESDASHESGQRLVAWLASHGVEADLHVAHGEPDELLPRLVGDVQAGLLVAGGYGHSRLRELVLGGSTRSLLRQTAFPVFMSH